MNSKNEVYQKEKNKKNKKKKLYIHKFVKKEILILNLSLLI